MKWTRNPSFLFRLTIAVVFAYSTTHSFPIGAMALSHARSIMFRRGCVTSASSGGSVGGGRFGTSRNNSEHANTQNQHPSPAFVSPLVLCSTMRSSSTSGNGSNHLSSQSSKDSELNVKENNWSNYEKLVRKLYMTNLFNPVKLGLENMNKLHEILGSPMDQVCFDFADSFPFM